MGQFFSWVKSNEKELLIILENLAKKAVEASDAVLDLMDDPTNKDKIAHISEIETEADVLTRDIFSELNKTFITPLDREDMQRVASKIDDIMIKLDGSKQKKNLGSNSILPVSIAVKKLSAKIRKIPLFKTFLVKKNYRLPFPLMNIINGGVHANNDLRIQEFMIRPDKAKNFSEALRMCYLVIQNLKKILKTNHLSTSVGDEGGFAPMIKKNEDALRFIESAIKKSGFINGKDISICLDVAANELYKNKKYSIHSKNLISVKKTIIYYKKIIKRYKIKSIEDPFSENDWYSWNQFKKTIDKKIQVIGDDLFVTNLERLKVGFLNNSANSILIKLNQIGTVTETLEVIKFAHLIGFNTVVSHRSGDSEDTFISDLAVGTNSNQIKTGSLSRSERVAKYNQLIRIEEQLGKSSKMNKIP